MVLGPYAVAVQYETQNGIINAPIEDVTVGRHLGFKGGWDISEIEELIRSIDNEDVVYFLGTHIGTLLIPISRKCHKVIGYEANPDNFKFLNWNIQNNEIDNVTAYNCAVGDVEKQITFYKNKINSGGSKIKPIKDSFLYSYDNPDEIEVPMVSLDNDIKLKNLPLPNCIVVDIEGAEFFALQGMQQTLTNTRMLYIEYVPHHLKNVSNVSNTAFIDLIFPYFDKVKFVRMKKEIEITTTNEELIKLLDNLEAKNQSDDLLFSKIT